MVLTLTILDIEFPNYISESVPYFIIFIVLEQILFIIFKKKDDFMLKDSFSSLAAGLTTMIYEKIVPVTILKSMEYMVIIWIWVNYRVVDLPDDSKLISFISFILIDIGFYWIHRLSHEVNILWSSHVSHHSSEKYNLTTALRLSIFQIYTSWIFYIPIGFFIPPQTYFFHKQWNTIYQFWLHSKIIGKLGPIEWIFNTPSHHRVHHGRNPKYLDKNYAGTLIIWDKLFGTFQEEEEEEEIYYGLVKVVGSTDPTWCQIHHFYEMYKRAMEYRNWLDKAKVLIYGPGWKPGEPRLGLYSEIPVPTKEDYFDRLGETLSYTMNTYLFIHFTIISMLSTVFLSVFENILGSTKILIIMAYFYYSLTTFGSIFDKKKYGMKLEIIRLVLFLAFTWENENSLILYIRYLYFVSSVWIITNHFGELSLKSLKYFY